MSEKVVVKLAWINDSHKGKPLPSYATPGSAGMDVCAYLEKKMVIEPGKTVLVPTGFMIELPEGFEAQIRPRSGLAINRSIGILNSPGTIDSDYRGEVKILLTNFGDTPFEVNDGDRIAQMVVTRYHRAVWEVVPRLTNTHRGDGGFGSTGLSDGKRNSSV